MRARRLRVGAMAVALATGIGIAGAIPAAADSTWSGTVTVSSADISSGYTTSNCNWRVFGDGPIYSEATTFTPTADGPYTFTVQAADMGGVSPALTTTLAVFASSYTEANCVESASGFDPVYASVTATLHAGTTYVLVFWGSGHEGFGPDTLGTFSVAMPTVVAPPNDATGPDLTTDLQSYSRSSRDTLCLDGWGPSWAQWPNGHRGGWTCDRLVLRFPS